MGLLFSQLEDISALSFLQMFPTKELLTKAQCEQDPFSKLTLHFWKVEETGPEVPLNHLFQIQVCKVSPSWGSQERILLKKHLPLPSPWSTIHF